MSEIRNCPTCDALFQYKGVIDACLACYKKEEEQYLIVYRYLQKRQNRAATIPDIVDATGVKENLLYKWLRIGKIHAASFPNLGYPCTHCGGLTKKGKLCTSCSDHLKQGLEKLEAQKEFKETLKKNKNNSYFTK